LQSEIRELLKDADFSKVSGCSQNRCWAWVCNQIACAIMCWWLLILCVGDSTCSNHHLLCWIVSSRFCKHWFCDNLVVFCLSSVSIVQVTFTDVITQLGKHCSLGIYCCNSCLVADPSSLRFNLIGSIIFYLHIYLTSFARSDSK
jgi:hypothetical protein